jgi:hypothetical protein
MDQLFSARWKAGEGAAMPLGRLANEEIAFPLLGLLGGS